MSRNHTYERCGGDARHGLDFEFATTTLAYLRCKNLHKSFKETNNSGIKTFFVANNVANIGSFDDVVIKVVYFEDFKLKTKLIFVQCKHVADAAKNSERIFQTLVKDIQKYFNGFIKIYEIFKPSMSVSEHENVGNTSAPKKLKPSTEGIKNFFDCHFTDIEFVYYSNIDIDCIDKLCIFEKVAKNRYDCITDNILSSRKSEWLLRLKNIDILKSVPEYKHLRAKFCEQFTARINQSDNLETNVFQEMQLLVPSTNRIHTLGKLFTEEIYEHFSSSTSCTALSEESKVVDKIVAYECLKYKSEETIAHFKKNPSFHRLFSDDAIRQLEQLISMSPLANVVVLSTNCKELEKRKVIQCFNFSVEVCLFIISNDEDERNWYLARETKAYNKWKQVKICSEFISEKVLTLKPNEILVQIVNTCEEYDPIAYYETLTPETEQILLSSKVSFQGKLQELGHCSDGKWKNFLDEDTICKMLEDKLVLNIGKPLAKLDFYIDRKFKIRTINATKLPYINLSQNFKLLLFSERNIKIPNIAKTFVWCENMPEARNLLQNIPEGTKDDIHLCFYNAKNNSQNSELIYSFGRTSKLVETAVVEENYLLQQRETSKIVILSDIAGMGKTTTLLNIARTFKEANPSHWVYFFELNKYLKELMSGKFLDKKTAVNFVAETLLKLKGIGLKMFIDACIETGNVVLCFDAFDEISPDAEKMLPKLLKFLEETKIKKIIVSSRPNFARHLEQQIYQNSIEFIPFTSEDKENFLLKKWRKMMKNEKKDSNADETHMMEGAIKNILGEIVYETNSIEELLGIPLQMKMIGEIYFDKFILMLERKVGAEDFRINLYSLYDKFISLHTIRYRTEKEGITWNDLPQRTQVSLIEEKLKGVEKFSTGFVCPELNIFEINKDVGVKLCNELGLIKTLQPPVFIHRTFAEFLAAKYLVKQIICDKINQQSKVILIFFHDSIAINEKYETLRTFINATFGNEDFKDRDINTADIKICRLIDGNTALHIAALEGNIEILEKLLVLNNYNINERNSRKQTPLLLACQKAKTSETVKYFINYPECLVNAEDNEGDSALHYASRRGHTDLIKILLDRETSLLNKQNKVGETPLHLAFYCGKCDAVKELLTTIGCQVDAENNDGDSALHFASELGHTDIIKILLDRDLSLLNKQNKRGETPLHLASYRGKCDAVKELLNNNECQVDTENNYGYSALHYASALGNTDIIKILLDRDLTLLNKQNKDGDTPLHLASYHGKFDTVKELLTTFGCQVDAENNDGNSALHFASVVGNTDIIKILLDRDLSLLNKQNKRGETPLHLASLNGNCDVMKELLTTIGCQIDAENNDGNSALHYASWKGHTDIIKILLDRDLSLLNKQNKRALTPLHLASYRGKCDAVKELVNKNECQVDAENNNGESALHFASVVGNTDIIKILLDRDLTLLNKQNKVGDTPLHWASYCGKCDAVKELLNNNECQVDTEDNDGDSALHFASVVGNTDIIKILLDRDLTLLNKQNKNGDTPLHSAIENNKCDAVKELLNNIGCQVDAENNDGYSALHYASRRRHTDIIKILLDRDPSLLNKQNKDGKTPLHLASYRGNCDSVKELLNIIECQVDTEDIDGNSAIHHASRMGHTNVIKILLDRDLSLLNKQNIHGESPLHLAASFMRFEAVNHLLSYSECSVDIKDKAEKSALNIAQNRGFTKIVNSILERDTQTPSKAMRI